MHSRNLEYASDAKSSRDCMLIRVMYAAYHNSVFTNKTTKQPSTVPHVLITSTASACTGVAEACSASVAACCLACLSFSPRWHAYVQHKHTANELSMM